MGRGFCEVEGPLLVLVLVLVVVEASLGVAWFVMVVLVVVGFFAGSLVDFFRIAAAAWEFVDARDLDLGGRR